ncbi:hypothetical protein VP01_361g11 [Puccinia sorghi]|uniref:Ribosomal silencing factor RsfS n=1 Tax=Puccinia sorghi TaxID=27349 RepID=A0A0L6UUW8_9BASI|nr:hypothetical protein VP01_361g11 [Puccinia sorghi]
MNSAQQIITRWRWITRAHGRYRVAQPSHYIPPRSWTKVRGFQPARPTRKLNDELTSEASRVAQEGTAGRGSEQTVTAIDSTPTPFNAVHWEAQPTRAPSGDNSEQPWFVDEEQEAWSARSLEDDEGVGSDDDLRQTGDPLPARPANLPHDLEPLYSHLTSSPFFHPSSVAFIDAKLSPLGDAAWTDWVVLVSLRIGRERALRGAAESVQSILEGKMEVRVEGLNSSSPSTTWAMVDGGKVVIHILTDESRKLYDLESVWQTRSPSSAAVSQYSTHYPEESLS